MKKIFDSADQYCKESNWMTIAMLKICVMAMGIMMGMLIPDKAKKKAFPIFGVIYSGTVVILLKKYFEILRRK